MSKVSIKIVRNDNKEFLIDGTDWKIPSDGLDGFGDFENDIESVDNAIGDGGIITSSRIAQKDRTITAKSSNSYLNEIMRKQVLSFFISKASYKVYVTYMGVTRWFEGTIHKFYCPAQNIYRPLTLMLTFYCQSPFFKSYDNFGKNIASVMGMCAFPYLCSVTDGTSKGITGGKFNFAKVIVLENDGDVETFCKAVFVAKGSVVNPKLVINEKYVRVIDEMVDGDTIIIDFTMNPPTVTKNGLNYIGHCDRTSDFDEMALVVGDSEVSFDADSGSNLLEVSIYYNKLYSAI